MSLSRAGAGVRTFAFAATPLGSGLGLGVALALAAGLAGCACFRGGLDDFRCETTADCEPPRVCEAVSSGERYCVEPGGDAGSDAGADSGGDAGTDAGPIACDGNEDCTAKSTMCRMGVCNVPAGICETMPINEDAPCDDGLFCTDLDVCSTGNCEGEMRDCSAAGTGPCAPGACDELGDVCAPSPLPDGTGCDDGALCSSADACTGGVCDGTRDEGLCGLTSVCNPIAYAGGCGAAPATLTIACPAMSTSGSETCDLLLETMTGTGVAGEAGRITCTAVPRAVLLFEDDFESYMSGTLSGPWTIVSGTASTTTDTGSRTATATSGTYEADITVDVTGLAEVCIDFDAGTESSAGGEAIEWDISLDGGTMVTVFSMQMGDLPTDELLHDWNRGVCFAVTGGTSLLARMRLESDSNKVYVDNVSITGLAAARTVAIGGGPDGFGDLLQWTELVTTGVAQVGTFGWTGVNSVLYADTVDPDDDFILERSIDATSCDVLDVDFDFAKYMTDANEIIEVSATTGPLAFAFLSSIDLNAAAWYPSNVLFPWFGLHRVTDVRPTAAGATSVLVRVRLAASGGSIRIVYFDNFTAWCTDLPDPTVGPVTDAGSGSYTVSITTSGREDVLVTCSWETTDDGPIEDSATILFE